MYPRCLLRYIVSCFSKEGRLARAGGSKENAELSLLQREIDSLKDLHAAVALTEGLLDLFNFQKHDSAFIPSNILNCLGCLRLARNCLRLTRDCMRLGPGCLRLGPGCDFLGTNIPIYGVPVIIAEAVLELRLGDVHQACHFIDRDPLVHMHQDILACLFCDQFLGVCAVRSLIRTHLDLISVSHG